MPSLGPVVASLVSSIVKDALTLLVPLGAGLCLLILVVTQSVSISSMTTASTRAELYRPLLVTVSQRSSGPASSGADGVPLFDDGVPAALLMAIAQTWSSFDPTRACRGAVSDARRGLLGVRPSEYQQQLNAIERLLARPALPTAQGLCVPEDNAAAAAARLTRLYLARQSEFVFENQAYRAALADYERQERAYRRCQEEQRSIEVGPVAPDRPEQPTCTTPDATLLVPPPACIEQYGDTNPRTPDRPDHRAAWTDRETICRIVRHYDEHLSFPMIWTARAAWQQLLAQPIHSQPRRPLWSEPGQAPGGTGGYAIGEAVRYARAQLGKPYVFGAVVETQNPHPRAFDCSGLVQWAYAQAGIRLPRTAEEQWRATQRVTYDQLQPGDLVFFCCDSDQPWTRVSHVGIYLGAGQMLDAPGPGRPVRIEAVWINDFIGGGRISQTQFQPTPTTRPPP